MIVFQYLAENWATLLNLLLVVLLIPAGLYFTIRTKVLPLRLFPEMLHVSVEKKQDQKSSALSGLQTMIVSTATRVGMGNLVGVVAAISVGGAGAVFWMWITALIGASTAFVEATLAQKHKRSDPLYGGYQGGPAYYIQDFADEKRQKKNKRTRKSVVAIFFALSGLLCWFGISQISSNSVTGAFEAAFHIKPLYTALVLVAVAAIILLRKKATVKVLDIMVPVMAGLFFLITVIVCCKNLFLLPDVFKRIFSEAFGLRQAVGGGFGAILMEGVKRGLFSNEAGSGSAPCAAAAAESDHPAKIGLLQSLGVFIDTIIICSCTAFLILLVPRSVSDGLGGMALLNAAMEHHLGQIGVIFITVTLFLFCFSTFLGILYYARSNVAFLFGSNLWSQTVYKIIALVMLFIGGIAGENFVWNLGDIGIALMTVFNLPVILLMGKEAFDCLKDYEHKRKTEKLQKKS